MLTFQKLHVYQRTLQFLAFATETIATLESLPSSSKHTELIDQLLRAAQSQPLNIAEGSGRRTARDRARFYTHARGSAMESAAVLDTLRVLGVIGEASCERGVGLLTEIVSMLTKMT